MKKFLAAVLVLGLSMVSALPAQAQMFRQALADNVYEQNIPNFRQMGLMPATGNEVNLDVVAIVAYEMATRDGSLATLPEEFRREAEYKTKFRTVNGLTDRTMPLEQFRALVNGSGIRLLRPSDFEATPPPAPVEAVPAPAPAETTPVESAPPAARAADLARVRGLENRIASAEAAARQGRITPAQLRELQALRAELNQAKTDMGHLTQTVGDIDGRVATTERRLNNAATVESVNAALATKADKGDVGVPWWGWALLGLAILLGLIGFAAYGRTIRLGTRVTTLEKDSADGAEHRFNIVIEDNMEDALNSLVEGEVRDIRVEHEGVAGYLGFEKVGKGKVITSQILDQTQAMNIKTLRSTIKRHIGAGRVQLRPLAEPLKAAA